MAAEPANVSGTVQAVNERIQRIQAELTGHGVAWGSGVGGFREDALYLPQPVNGGTVGEAIIGVPYRTWDGTVINAP